VHYKGDYPGTDPDWYLSQFNKIFFLFFVGSVCLNDEKKLKALFYVVVFSAAYLIYWANDQYLSGRMMGRLAGPVDVEGNGIYSDENNFAMLFVVAQPFLWYFGSSLKNRIWRWGVWLIIPFGWHAIFLTASRGGLIGIAVATLLTSLRSRHRFLGLLLIPAFWGAYQWQAGDMMKNRAESIGDTSETSTATRIEAWTAASHMIAANPVTGVGLASFVRAFDHYSDKHPREAHNTFLQVAAESGVLAGLTYFGLVFSSIVALSKNAKRLRAKRAPDDFLYLLNEATRVSLWGFSVCALFLSLQLFEFFYCLVLIANAVLFVSAKSQAERTRARAPSESASVRVRPDANVGLSLARLLPGNSSAS
jgi:O-antigen ligase